MKNKLNNIELDKKLSKSGEYVPTWVEVDTPEDAREEVGQCDDFGYINFQIECEYCGATGINSRGIGNCVMCKGTGVFKTIRTKCDGCPNCRNK